MRHKTSHFLQNDVTGYITTKLRYELPHEHSNNSLLPPPPNLIVPKLSTSHKVT